MKEFNIIKKKNARWLLKKYIPIKIQDLVEQFKQVGQDWTLWNFKWKIIRSKKLKRDRKLGLAQPALTLVLDAYFLEEKELPPKQMWLFRKIREWRINRIMMKDVSISHKAKEKMLAAS